MRAARPAVTAAAGRKGSAHATLVSCGEFDQRGCRFDPAAVSTGLQVVSSSLQSCRGVPKNEGVQLRSGPCRKPADRLLWSAHACELQATNTAISHAAFQPAWLLMLFTRGRAVGGPLKEGPNRTKGMCQPWRITCGNPVLRGLQRITS